MLLSDGTEPEALGTAARPPTARSPALPASAGTVTGRARVVLDPVGAHLEPGEILVAPSTDPGWTPLFLTAGGLVMEMGGANSHGAVVAREYGIPAVVGVRDAVTRLADVACAVDGTRGRVEVVQDFFFFFFFFFFLKKKKKKPAGRTGRCRCRGRRAPRPR